MIRGRLALSSFVKKGMHPILEAVIKVGIDVPIVGRRQGIPSGQNLFHRPAAGADAARGFGGPIIDDDPFFFGGTDPLVRERNAGVSVNRVIRIEIESQKGGDRLFFAIEKVDR